MATCLNRGNDHRHRKATAVDQQMDFGGQSVSGPAELFAIDGEVFDPSGLAPPFLRAPVRSFQSQDGVADVAMVPPLSTPS